MLSLIGQKSCPIKRRKCSCIHVFSRAWLQLRIVAWLSDWLTVLCSDWQLYLNFVMIPVECRKKLLSWSRSFNKWLANLALPNEKTIRLINFPVKRSMLRESYFLHTSSKSNWLVAKCRERNYLGCVSCECKRQVKNLQSVRPKKKLG